MNALLKTSFCSIFFLLAPAAVLADNLMCGQASPVVTYSGPLPVADVGVGDTPEAAIYDVLKDLFGYQCVIECPPEETCSKAAFVTGGRENVSNEPHQVGDVHFADMIITGQIKGFITCSACAKVEVE